MPSRIDPGGPRRLLYFSREYTTHDRRFLEALAGLRSHGEPWEVHFLQLEDDGVPYESRPLPAGVTRAYWPTSHGPRPVPAQESAGDHRPGGLKSLLPAYTQVLQELEPTVVQAGPIQSCAWLAAAAAASADAPLPGAPVLAVSWGSDILVHAHRDDDTRTATREALEGASAFLCDSEAVLDTARDFVPIPDERVVKFPWGIDLAAFSRGEGWGPVRPDWQDRKVVLSTRAWESLHGVETLLEAFALAHTADPELRLILGSTGSTADWVAGFLEEKGLRDVVHAPGQLPQGEIPGLFRSAHVYVSCAHSDGTSISLLEALASGLPVVVTDIPSNEEWVAPDQAWGWLAPAGDAPAVAQSLHAAFALSSEERSEVARRNREVAEERADWFRNVETLKAMLNQLAETS
ncbi:MAG: glycosyltransferase family 4 protein [Gemmatimonadota bacterium]